MWIPWTLLMPAGLFVLQEAMQQWYQHYHAHPYGAAAPQDATATEYSKEHSQVQASSRVSPLAFECSSYRWGLFGGV